MEQDVNDKQSANFVFGKTQEHGRRVFDYELDKLRWNYLFLFITPIMKGDCFGEYETICPTN